MDIEIVGMFLSQRLPPTPSLGRRKAATRNVAPATRPPNGSPTVLHHSVASIYPLVI